MSEQLHDVYQTLGAHGAQLENLGRTCDEIKAGQATVIASLGTLIADKHRAEGSRKMFYTLAAGLGSSAGAIAAAAVTWLKSSP